MLDSNTHCPCRPFKHNMLSVYICMQCLYPKGKAMHETPVLHLPSQKFLILEFFFGGNPHSANTSSVICTPHQRSSCFFYFLSTFRIVMHEIIFLFSNLNFYLHTNIFGECVFNFLRSLRRKKIK